MRLCGFDLSPGEKRAVTIPVPGGGGLEATLFCGAEEGKTLVVTAGVHGCEYNGIKALRALCHELDPRRLRGNVILAPLVNREGFYQGAKQIVPADGVNLNRAFPGDPSGTASARLAAAIEEHLYPRADLLADLHGGDVNEMAMPFVYFPAQAGEEVGRRAQAAAAALSVPYRVASSAKNGLYSWAAQRGVPALLLERGGRGCWSADEVDAYRRNVYELLSFLDILPGNFSAQGQREITQTVYLEAVREGFWYPRVAEGRSFPQGAVLGELRSETGELLQTCVAEFDGVTLYYTVALGVSAGEPLVAYGQL